MTVNTENAGMTHYEEVDDFIKYDKPIVQGISEEQKHFDALCFHALEHTDGGKALMEELRKFLSRPSWMPGQDKDMGVFAEGEKNLIRFIDQCIQRHKAGGQ